MLAQSYAPIVGGEERVVEDLSRELVARGHDVSVATLRQPGGGRRARSRGPGSSPAQHHLPHPRSTGTPSAATRRPLPTPRRSSTCGGCCGASAPRSSTPTTGSSTPTCRWPARPQRPRPLAARLRPGLRDQALPSRRRRLQRAGPVKCLLCAGDSLRAGARACVGGLRTRGSEPRLRRHGRRLPAGQRNRRASSAGSARTRSRRVVPNFIGELPEPPPPATRAWPRFPTSPSSSTSATSPSTRAPGAWPTPTGCSRTRRRWS